jgi:hypothetical protein
VGSQPDMRAAVFFVLGPPFSGEGACGQKYLDKKYEKENK